MIARSAPSVIARLVPRATAPSSRAVRDPTVRIDPSLTVRRSAPSVPAHPVPRATAPSSRAVQGLTGRIVPSVIARSAPLVIARLVPRATALHAAWSEARDREDRPFGDRPKRAYGDRPSRGRDETGASTARNRSAFDGDRIARAHARAGLCSRREAEDWIEAGRVSGQWAHHRQPGAEHHVGGSGAGRWQALPARERTRLWLFHKPAWLVTTESDPEGRPTVFDNLPEGLAARRVGWPPRHQHRRPASADQ